MREYQTYLPIDLRNPVNRNHPLANNLISLWIPVPTLVGGKFFYDLILNNHLLANLQSINAGWINCPISFGTALRTDGNNSTYYRNTQCNKLNSAKSSSGFSISIWASISSFSVGNTVILEINNSSTDVGTTGVAFKLVSSVFWDYETTGGLITPTFIPSLNTFYNFLFTGIISGNNFITNFYVNGIFIGSSSTSAITTMDNSIMNHIRLFSNSYLGGSEPAPSNCKIAEVAFWTRVLSNKDAQHWYNLGIRKYPNLLNRVPAYWKPRDQVFLPIYFGVPGTSLVVGV